MNFTKKRDVAIEFMKNIEDALILLSIPCIIFVPYLYISMLGYKEYNKIYTWIYGFLLILICCIIPAYLLYSVIKYVLMNIKISKISCKLPLTEKEMDEFAKNKTCEEIIMGMEKYLTYVVLGQVYHLYNNPKHMELLKPFYSYIKDNYTSEEIGTASELAKKIQNMDEKKDIYLIPK